MDKHNLSHGLISTQIPLDSISLNNLYYRPQKIYGTIPQLQPQPQPQPSPASKIHTTCPFGKPETNQPISQTKYPFVLETPKTNQSETNQTISQTISQTNFIKPVKRGGGDDNVPKTKKTKLEQYNLETCFPLFHEFVHNTLLFTKILSNNIKNQNKYYIYNNIIFEKKDTITFIAVGYFAANVSNTTNIINITYIIIDNMLMEVHKNIRNVNNEYADDENEINIFIIFRICTKSNTNIVTK